MDKIGKKIFYLNPNTKQTLKLANTAGAILNKKDLDEGTTPLNYFPPVSSHCSKAK